MPHWAPIASPVSLASGSADATPPDFIRYARADPFRVLAFGTQHEVSLAPMTQGAYAMSTKKQSRSGVGKKSTIDNKIALAVASIGATGLIIAALVTGILSSHSASPQPYPSNTGPSTASPLRSSASSAPSKELPGIRTETDEFQVLVYGDYSGPSEVEGQIHPGQAVAVYCRIPGDATTPTSVGSAGWYKVKDSNGNFGYAAANVFYNDPGNGNGMVPNNIAFDPLVSTC